MSERNRQQWEGMLNRLAARDGSVELSRGVGNDQGPPITYRARIFAVLNDGCMVVETPPQAVRDRAFRLGDDIDLTLMVNDERMIATCTLHELVTHTVNASLKVTCYRLSPGRRPAREQRRSSFRVSVAAMELPPIELKCEIDEQVFTCEGRLVNISATGLGVSVRAARQVLGKIKRTRQFTCTAWLDEEQQIEAPVELVHLSALGEDGLYLGLKFDIASETEAGAHEQFMQHRCTEIQRMQLKRRRA